MNPRLKYAVWTVLLLATLIWLKTLIPTATDWTPTYSGRDRIPFGTWILLDSFEDLFPASVVRINTQSLYERWHDDSTACRLVIVTGDFDPGTIDLDVLLRKAKDGSDILIAASRWPEALTDSLHVKTKESLAALPDTAAILRILSDGEWGREYHFSKLIQSCWFELPDTTAAVVLGEGNGRVNYVRVPCGKGNFFLHALPQVFTNYHVLYNDHRYLEEVLARLPENGCHTVWDEYYKPFRSENRSPIKVILSQKSLRAAYWTLLAGLLLYILTNIRRRQRPIPVMTSKANLSLDFVRTIGLLYFNQQNHKNLLEKIFVVFSEHINSKYFLRIEFTPAFCSALALKSAVNEQVINRIFTCYQTLSAQEQVHEEELTIFNGLIELFYRESRSASAQNTQKNKK